MEENKPQFKNDEEVQEPSILTVNDELRTPSLHFHSVNGKAVTINMVTGKVELFVEVEEAAKVFWQAVEKAFNQTSLYHLQNKVFKLQTENNILQLEKRALKDALILPQCPDCIKYDVLASTITKGEQTEQGTKYTCSAQHEFFVEKE